MLCSQQFGEQIERYLKQYSSIPAFLADVTLDLFRRSSMKM
jgi:hypothetical protein